MASGYLELNSEIQKKHIFKCQRLKVNNVKQTDSVKVISFNICGMFTMGGFDGFVTIWGQFNQRATAQLPLIPCQYHITCLRNDGTTLAMAS